MRKVLAILSLVIVLFSFTFCSAEKIQTTDKEIVFMGFEFGTPYSAVQKSLKTMNAYPFKNEYVNLSSGLSLYADKEIFSDIIPYRKSEKIMGISQRPMMSTTGDKVAGYDIGSIYLQYAPFDLNNLKTIKDENSYSLIGGTYVFQFSNAQPYANTGRETNNPYADGMKMFDDLKSKLSVLYGEPITRYGEKSSKDNTTGKEYKTTYCLWLGANNSGVLLAYYTDSGTFQKKPYYQSVIYIIYGRTDIGTMIDLYESNQGYEGL